jgi:hypothetical protein
VVTTKESLYGENVIHDLLSNFGRVTGFRIQEAHQDHKLVTGIRHHGGLKGPFIMDPLKPTLGPASSIIGVAVPMAPESCLDAAMHKQDIATKWLLYAFISVFC